MLIDYQCKSCGYMKEEFFLSSEPKPEFINCNKCGGKNTMQRVIAAAKAHFKGPGFPTNDTKKWRGGNSV